jgi:predicted NBD/HSP70 family sugar kinase
VAEAVEEIRNGSGLHVSVLPLGTADIRRSNLRLVLQLVRRLAPLTRSSLVSASGLNRATVLDLVAELQKRGFVSESGFAPAGRRGGRPARVLEMDDSRLAVGALEVNVDHGAIKCASLQGRVLFSRRIDLDSSESGPERIIQLLAGLVDSAWSALSETGTRLVWVSVGCPAYVNTSTGTVISSRSLDWHGIPVVAELGALTKGDVHFTLDRLANLAIHAERKAGGWNTDEGIVVLYGDFGIGGSYQRNGQVLRGDFGIGAEFGHVLVEPGGRPCVCGMRGCLEAYVGLGPLAQALGIPADGRGRRPLAQILASLSKPGPEVRAEVGRQGTRLAQAVASLISVFDPHAVVLGGQLTAVAPLMMPSFRAELERVRAMHTSRANVLVSKLGTSAVLDGGIEAAIHDLCLSPSLIR